MTEFKQGDRVYTQDGSEYYFDHVAGNHGYVSPYFIIQTTNYHGDDFDEHEEVADHVVPIALDKLSLTPWVKKIHIETNEAIQVRHKELQEIQLSIGAARTEEREAKAVLEQTRKDLEVEARNLARDYTWLRTCKLLMEGYTDFVVNVDGDIPYKMEAPKRFGVKKVEDEYVVSTESDWDYEESDRFVAFPSKYEMEAFIRKENFNAKDLTPEQELEWCRRWPFLPVTDAAKALKAEKEAAAHKKKVEGLELARDRAQQELNKANEKLKELGEDTDVD